MNLNKWRKACQAREEAGGIMPGWTAETWRRELERKVAACDERHQDQAERWRRWVAKMGEQHVGSA